MSQMIPSFIDYKVESTAEKRIYDWFQTCPYTSDWTVLYSQVEINHSTLIVGESDFVVLAPRLGIFILEVKGGRVTRDENGIWHFISKSGKENTKARGPFEQAKEGMFSLKKYLEKQDSSLKGLLWGYGVMVPDMDNFYVPNDEFCPQMIFDRTDGNRVDSFIKRLSLYNSNKIAEIYHVQAIFPTQQQCRKIKEILRPSFDCAPSMSTLIGEAIQEQLRFTSEQFNALDAVEDNKRCLFLGGAGTGKTLLAKEIVRRSNNERIGFFCFNKTLAEWIKQDFKNENLLRKCSYVGDFHSLMISNIKKANLLSQVNWANNNPFSESLFTAFMHSLEEYPISFDFIVIDEFQDLFDEKECFLVALDSILEKGLERGRFAFFGDFDHQSLYHPSISLESVTDTLEKYTSFTKCRLTINCRNTPEICQTITDLTGVKYKSVRLHPSHLQPKFKQYKTDDDEKAKLDDLFHTLIVEQKISPSDIVILSPKSRKRSVIRNYKTSEIDNLTIPKTDRITFSTIYSFKGLESPVIIITDVESYKNQHLANNESLIYVGVSRAKAQLYIFENPQATMERILKE